MTDADLDAQARAIIDADFDMVPGTADEDGRPWVTPTAADRRTSPCPKRP